MFELKENFSLKNHNTFGIDVNTKYYVSCSSENDLIAFLNIPERKELPLMILGGGSNILFTEDFNGYIIYPNIKGIEISSENENEIDIRVGAGEDWDELVAYCVEKGWGGLENLSLIPGNVGTCPIQNIGAYGVEVKDVITLVETIDINTLNKLNYTNAKCEFAYRDSIFKRKLKGKQIITHVHFKLKKRPDFNLEYGNLNLKLQEFNEVSLKNIRKAVIEIRESKLPKPEELGNAGSFFKNPIVKKIIANAIKESYPDVPMYPLDKDYVKIPAGWLIEKARLKGKRSGNVGIHNKQALVIVNYGNATGQEIIHFAKNIQKDILKLFDIELEMEVNVV